MAINPISKESKLGIKSSKFGADIAISTNNHPDYNGFEIVTYKGEIPFRISGPGEYETKGLYIKGFLSKANIENKESINTIYMIEIDGLTVWFIGAISSEEIDKTIREAIDEVDILFLPIGGNGTLDPIEAAKFSKIFSSKIIIPMDYGADRDKDSLKTFLKEMGSEETKPVPKLTLRKKDLGDKSGEVIILDII